MIKEKLDENYLTRLKTKLVGYELIRAKLSGELAELSDDLVSLIQSEEESVSDFSSFSNDYIDSKIISLVDELKLKVRSVDEFYQLVDELIDKKSIVDICKLFGISDLRLADYIRHNLNEILSHMVFYQCYC